jgi:hypothetical protein
MLFSGFADSHSLLLARSRAASLQKDVTNQTLKKIREEQIVIIRSCYPALLRDTSKLGCIWVAVSYPSAMDTKPLFTQCPVCRAAVDLISDRNAPYTVFRCEGCGPYSLTNELTADLAAGKLETPDREVFRDWLRRETVLESLKGQGPLITAGTFKKIRRSMH